MIEKEKSPDVEYGKNYARYQQKRGLLRKAVRRFYLNNILKHVKGRAVDFGCGAGELLALCPGGSIGFDINDEAVAYCKKKGLNAKRYSSESDRYGFIECGAGEYKTFLAVHVLEHLDEAAHIMRLIFGSCKRLKIERIIIVVPGPRGFRFDKTHKSFIDAAYLENNHLREMEDFALTKLAYFPFNSESIGAYFTHNETVMIYDRKR